MYMYIETTNKDIQLKFYAHVKPINLITIMCLSIEYIVYMYIDDFFNQHCSCTCSSQGAPAPPGGRREGASTPPTDQLPMVSAVQSLHIYLYHTAAETC